MFDFVHGNEYVLFGNQSTANYLMNFRVHFALKTCVNVVFSKRGGGGGFLPGNRLNLKLRLRRIKGLRATTTLSPTLNLKNFSCFCGTIIDGCLK
jgi:hypothetical protein